MTKIIDWRGHAWIGLPIRLYLAAVFAVACLHKIADPASFALDVATYQFLPLGAVNLFAIVLPWLELTVAIVLVAGLRVRAAAVLVVVMMLSFMVALSWALHHHLDISCGCFASQGATHDPISGRTLLRDSIWLLLACYIFLFDRKAFGMDRWLAGRRTSHA